MQLFSRNKAIVALSLGALALGACGDDVTVPVTPPAPITLSITPPSANMNIGESVNFAVQLSGGSATSSPTITCTSSSAAVATATVSGSACRVTAVAAGNATITATASTGQSASASVSVAAQGAAISGLTVSPSSSQIAIGQSTTLVPNVTRANAAVAVVYSYASSAADVAMVSSAGVVTAVAPGTAIITVTAAGTGTGFSSATLTAASSVTVSARTAGISSVSVAPSSASIQQGRTLQLAPVVSQPAGAPTATVTYGTTTPSVALVSATGEVTAVAPGTATITITASHAQTGAFAATSVTATSVVTVTALPSGLSTVSAAPAAITILTGKTAQVTASATQPSGAPAATFTYSSSATNIATVSATGVISGVAPGQAVISVAGASAASPDFAAGSATATVSVTVSALPSGLSTVSAAPAAITILTGKTAQVTASATQPSGAPAATFTYTSNATDIATVSATGVVSAVAPGQAVISVAGASAASPDFAAGSATATVSVTVSALPTGMTAVSVNPGTASIRQGRTLQLAYSASQPQGAAAATWSFGTTAPAVATVSATGEVSAVAPGTAVITATATSAANGDFAAATLTGQVTVTVTALTAGLTAVAVAPGSASIRQGRTLQLDFSATQPQGAAAATWSFGTTAPAVATVSATGEVSAVAPGTAVITATATSAANADFAAATMTGQVTVTVTALTAGLTAVAVAPGSASLMAGRTLQLDFSATQPQGAAAATWSFGSSAAAVATVDPTSGLITAVAPGTAVITATATAATNADFAGASMTSQVTITVTALPAGLTAVVLSPTALSLTVGSTGTLTASASGPGAGAATTAFASSSAAVATVDAATGVVTAVAPGTSTITATTTTAATADFAGATVSATALVTVAQLAQVSITSVTTLAGVAVDANSVSGNILVNVNITTNGNNVSSAQLFSCAVGAVCPAVGQQPVAQQTFGSAGASGGAIQFNMNTAAFRVSNDTTSTTVDFQNGQRTMVATLSTAGNATSANSNIAVLNFVNTDGWAAFHTPPQRNAREVPANSNLWYGGPGTEGRGRVIIVPVTYTPNITISTVTARLGPVPPAAAVANCSAGGTAAGTVTFTGARPWTFTYGETLGTGTANATNVVCTGTSAAADVVPVITTALDNNNATYGTTLLTSTTTTSAVTLPASIRGDWQNASTPVYALYTPANGVAGWVNRSFKFDSSANVNLAAMIAAETGVGLDTALTVFETAGCGVATYAALVTDQTGNALNECGADLSNAAYSIRARSVDRLGNISANSNVATFGVDHTAPQIRYATGSDTTGHIRNAFAGTYMTAQVLDERSGFDAANAARHYVARTRRGGASAATACVVGTFPGVLTNTGANPVTAPNCVMAAAGALGAAAGDGYRPMPEFGATTSAVALTQSGYYTYRATIFDRAGNPNSTEIRSILIDATAPGTGVNAMASSIPLMAAGTITGTYSTPFDGIFRDSVETRTTSFGLIYGTDTLAYPATLTSHASFNDAITRDSTVSQTTPFTSGTRFYTNLEVTDPAGVPQGAAGVLAATAVGLSATDFSSFTGVSFTAFTGQVTADAVVWTAPPPALSKSAALTNFLVTNSTAAFASPAGGLKARAVGTTALANSPFTRVDYYRLATSGRFEYVGSVDASATPCTADTATCGVYVADNGAERVFTYVLRTAQGNSTTGAALSLTTGTYRAIGITGTAGRGLMSQSVALAPAP